MTDRIRVERIYGFPLQQKRVYFDVFLLPQEGTEPEKVVFEVKLRDKKDNKVTSGRWIKFSRSMYREALKQMIKIYAMWEMKNGKSPTEVAIDIKKITEEARLLAALDVKRIIAEMKYKKLI